MFCYDSSVNVAPTVAWGRNAQILKKSSLKPCDRLDEKRCTFGFSVMYSRSAAIRESSTFTLVSIQYMRSDVSREIYWSFSLTPRMFLRFTEKLTSSGSCPRVGGSSWMLYPSCKMILLSVMHSVPPSIINVKIETTSAAFHIFRSSANFSRQFTQWPHSWNVVPNFWRIPQVFAYSSHN